MANRLLRAYLLKQLPVLQPEIERIVRDELASVPARRGVDLNAAAKAYRAIFDQTDLTKHPRSDDDGGCE